MITCKQCGKLNPENFNYCLDCGAELDPDSQHSAESQFFIDLSAESPDVKAAHEEILERRDKIPSADIRMKQEESLPKMDKVDFEQEIEEVPEEESSLSAGEKMSEKPKPTGDAIELLPDDLLGDDDSDELLSKPISGFDSGSLAVSVDKPLAGNEPIDKAEAKEVEEIDSEIIEIDDDIMEIDGVELPEVDESILVDDEIEIDDVEVSSEPVPETPVVEPEKEINDGNLEVDMSSEEIQCSKCGATLEKDIKFCPQCGTPTAEEADSGAGKTMFMHVGEIDEDQAKTVGRLTILEPSGKEGKVYNLSDGENVCGRQNGDVLIEDKFVSPTHCNLNFADNKVTLVDKDSLNGVYIKVKGDIEIKSKTMIRIGQQLFQFIALADFDDVENDLEDDGTTFLGSPLGNLWGKLLQINNKGRVVKVYPLRTPILTVGRDTGDIVLSGDGFVSGTHAQVSNKDGKFVLTDLGSSNGTYLQISNLELNNNDMVLIGGKLLRFEYM